MGVDLNQEVPKDKQMCDPKGTAWNRNVSYPCPRCGRGMQTIWLGNVLEGYECACGHTITAQD